MPGRSGVTVMRATPPAFVRPLFAKPGPRTSTFAPFTALPRFRTIAAIVERLPTDSVFGPTVSVEQTAGAGFGFEGGLVTNYYLTRHLRVALSLNYERLSDDAAASPLAEDDYVMAYFSGLAWTF